MLAPPQQRSNAHEVTTSVMRVGISSCLLGTKVRFDGGHQRDTSIVNMLGQFFTWIPVCPEVEMGLGTPRESLRLVGPPEAPRLVTERSHDDMTTAMQRFATVRLDELAQIGLHGFILKKNSPSCGMERVRLYDQQGVSQYRGRSIFAAALRQRFPLLPIEEEDRLHNTGRREHFIERVFAYYRWVELVTLPPTPADLAQFHTRHKLTLLTHSREHSRALAGLMAQASALSMDDLLGAYGSTFMACLKVKATPKKHANVLYHLLGHLKRQLDTADKQEVIACIEQYREGRLPLLAPLTLLWHHFRRHPVPWVLEQTYMTPYPAELMLRYHA